MSYRLGIDIGGTFTDLVLIDDAGVSTQWKTPSTRDDPLRGIGDGLDGLADHLGVSSERMIAAVDTVVHGSTLATNTLIEHDGGPIGLVCTAGFRDVAFIREGYKPSRFDLRVARPADFAERSLRRGVEERIGPDGSVRVPLCEQDVVSAAERFREAGVTGVAVCLLWSVVNPEHELRVRDILEPQLPGVPVLLSHDVLPESPEWPRTSATLLSAYVTPRIGDYLQRFETMLENLGLGSVPSYMQVNGGVGTLRDVMRRPVNLVHSGPAAAPAAAFAAARAAGLGEDGALLVTDMGGTSFDVCIVKDGHPQRSRTMQVEGHPLGVMATAVESIGAGGGSIAWIDDGGAVRVGPISAGASPGPACYDRGGTRPTVTDANLVLGFLDPARFLGGRHALRTDLARDAIRGALAQPLGVGVETAAASVIEIVDANMLRGIESVSIERGVDPRDHVLISAGGAGSLHTARLARQLGINTVLFPKEASTFCAFGMCVTDARHDDAFVAGVTTTSMDVSTVEHRFAQLEREARQRLRASGYPEEAIAFTRSLDVRYRGQVHDLTIPMPPRDADELAGAIEEAFHTHHERAYTFALRDQVVEILHWRLGTTAARPLVARSDSNGHGDSRRATPVGRRDIYSLPLRRLESVPVYRFEDLGPGQLVPGPAVIESDVTTILLGDGDEGIMTIGGHLVTTIRGQ